MRHWPLFQRLRRIVAGAPPAGRACYTTRCHVTPTPADVCAAGLIVLDLNFWQVSDAEPRKRGPGASPGGGRSYQNALSRRMTRQLKSPVLRTTERYRRSVLWACENFTDLTHVRRAYGCSSGYLYEALYTQLELQRRKRLYPWPVTIGLDEHFFRRGKGGFRQFVSMVVDYKNRRLFELVEGRTVGEMEASLQHIEGRENVRNVVLDMGDPYRSFAKRFFPNARLVADKFHVLRLLSPTINRHRRLVEGDRRSAALRRLLLRSRYRLGYAERLALDQWLLKHPELRALYEAKEAMHMLYRTRGYHRAAQALTALTDRLAASPMPELQTFRRTLMRWCREILEYFRAGLTNGRTEGFNNKAKVVKKRAYGYRSFRNYRLRLLNAARLK
jgi:transposase